MLGRRKRGGGGQQSPDEIYRDLRTLALDSPAHGLALPDADHPDVSGLVIDIPAQGGFATVVSLTDNTTSMYTSTGGGTIGAGEHTNVAVATQQLLSTVQAHLGAFKKKDDVDLPPAGYVRFHLLSPGGSRFEDIAEDSFWGRTPHHLVPVIAAAQEVLTAIRDASPNS